MSYYLFKEEDLTEDQKHRLYDFIMELGPYNDVSYEQHVAEIRAEAGRAGFFAAINLVRMQPERANHAVFVCQKADEYAAKVRQGGE